jgi:hypothetical protein
MKKACKFIETVRLFVCFLPVFQSFRIRVLYLSTFHFCQPRLVALKTHNCTDLKLGKQYWNFNEFNFYF